MRCMGLAHFVIRCSVIFGDSRTTALAPLVTAAVIAVITFVAVSPRAVTSSRNICSGSAGVNARVDATLLIAG